MRVPRSLTVLSLVAAAAATLTATSAGAAGQACKLIQDKENDTFLLRNQDTVGGPYGPQEDTLDIVSADIATDAKSITGVMRVKKLSTRAGTAPNGFTFRISFSTPEVTAADRNLYLDGRVEGDGKTVFSVGFRDRLTNLGTKLGDAVGVVDDKASEVRITAPLAFFAATNGGIKPGMVLEFEGLDHTTARYSATNPATGGGGTSVFADVARSDATYKAGTKSCVKVGK